MLIRVTSTDLWLSSLRRGMAIVLLLFAVVDLGTTMPCCAEELGLPVAAVDAHLARVDSVVTDHEHDTVNLPASDDRAPAQPVGGVDGCFCCALAIPASVVAVETNYSLAPPTDLGGVSLPTASPRTPYHPPRLA
jgi:hypothetical protein